jgi:uncharacterized protein YbjT (DUF2867 family)
MKYVITGGAGNISKPLTEQLLKAGHQVTVIGRNAENLKDLTALGATAAIGSVEDIPFLTKTFTGANAVYTMVPPNYAAPDLKAYIIRIGKNYTEAIKASGIKYVVNLSSIGAHLSKGAGPVSALYYVEESFNSLKDVNIIHLRPGYFFLNFLGSIGMVKHAGILGANFGSGDDKIVMVNPADIAPVAAEALLSLKFTGHTVKYIASDERTGSDIAKILGSAIGKSDLPWIRFSDEDAYNGMVQAGLPQEVALNYRDMGQVINDGTMFEDYWKHRPTLSKTKLEDFAKVFAAVYNNNSA